MTASASEHFELTLRGFSPKELNARAERECRKHFGECAWQIDKATCVPLHGNSRRPGSPVQTHVIARSENG